MAEFDKAKSYLWAELYLDGLDGPHIILHTQDEDFPRAKAALVKFITLLQVQVNSERLCPFYKGGN